MTEHAGDSRGLHRAAQLESYERGLIRDALRAAKGVVVDAATLLQVPKNTLYDKLTRHGLEPELFRRWRR